LIDVVNQKLQTVDNIILSGHFCIFDKENNVEHLPEFVFVALHIKAIILLESNMDVVSENLISRDSRPYPLAAIKTLIECEKSYALKISNKLNIPIYIHKMNFCSSDVEMVLDFINNI
jgi:adenylate kinase